MATFQEFNIIKPSWETVDRDLRTLQPQQQDKIRQCLSILDDVVQPVIHKISIRDPQAGTDLAKNNADRRKRLVDLMDLYVQQTADELRDQLRELEQQLQQMVERGEEEEEEEFEGEGDDDERALSEVMESLDRLHPQLNDVGLNSAPASQNLGEHFVQLLRQVRILALRPPRHADRLQFTSDKIDGRNVEYLTKMIRDFDATMKEASQLQQQLLILLQQQQQQQQLQQQQLQQQQQQVMQNQQQQHAKVVKGLEQLDDFCEKMNKVGEIDADLGNQMSVAHKQRREKLMLADLTQQVIDVQLLFIQFDQTYPQINDVKTINKGMEFLNSSSPIINTVGGNNPLKGNELARSYNMRMKTLTSLGQTIGTAQQKS